MTKVKTAYIAFADTEDARSYLVMASDKHGYEYTLLNEEGDLRHLSFFKANMIVDKIKANGNVINPDYWACHAPYGTEAWLLDGMEERQMEDERFGYC
jgi:hypothetical protein